MGFPVGRGAVVFGRVWLGTIRHGKTRVSRLGGVRCCAVMPGVVWVSWSDMVRRCSVWLGVALCGLDWRGFRGCARCDTVRFGTVWKGMGFTIWSGEAGCCSAR